MTGKNINSVQRQLISTIKLKILYNRDIAVVHSPYLMMGKDWWVIVFIQNFDYDSAGAV